MNIYLIRHGESQSNLLNKSKYKMFSGQYDSSLTKKGEKQALKLFSMINKMTFDKVYSSDLSRAVRTAEIIFPTEEINKTPLLRERSLGIFEGKRIYDISNKEEYKQYFTDTDYKDFRHSFVTKAPEGESYTDVLKRIDLFFSSLQFTDFENIAIVSHAVTMKCIMKFLLNLSKNEVFNLRINNCQPIRIINDNGVFTINNKIVGCDNNSYFL